MLTELPLFQGVPIPHNDETVAGNMLVYILNQTPPDVFL